jgi:plasmid stability protein
LASLTIRNIPEDAKLRFRQVAAAHGRSMEDHLRQMVINASLNEASPTPGVSEVKMGFRHEPVALTGQRGVMPDGDNAARIRAMSSAEFFKYLVETAGGVGLELPPRANFAEDREVFGAD